MLNQTMMMHRLFYLIIVKKRGVDACILRHALGQAAREAGDVTRGSLRALFCEAAPAGLLLRLDA